MCFLKKLSPLRLSFLNHVSKTLLFEPIEASVAIGATVHITVMVTGQMHPLSGHHTVGLVAIDRGLDRPLDPKLEDVSYRRYSLIIQLTVFTQLQSRGVGVCGGGCRHSVLEGFLHL